MDAAVYTLMILNSVLGLGCGWPIAKMLASLRPQPRGRVRLFLTLLAFYVLECAAFSASMGTGVFSIGLAFVWGVGLGEWLRRRRDIPRDRLLKTASGVALYSGLPAASFLAVPVVCALKGWHLLSSATGYQFGVPGFLPWPLGTILGFSVSLSLCVFALKFLITMGICVSWLRRAGPRALGETVL